MLGELQLKIEEVIENYMATYGDNPLVIICHPLTWELLCIEIFGGDGMDAFEDLTYKRIQVTTNPSLEQGQFKAY